MESTYVPGVCNLGPAERARRIQIGWTGLIVAIVLEVLFVVFTVPSALRIIIFFPVFLSAMGFLQAYDHFCVAYGLKGVFNVSMSVGKTDTVSQAEFRTLDKQKAQKIIVGAFAIALAVTFVVVGLA